MNNPENKEQIITRFAPSPTGYLHAGNYRTALYAYFVARKNGGKFLLRIEDTDRERSEKQYEANIFETLEWLGLEFDGMERQSDRVANHKAYLEKLIKEDKAYISKETPVKEGDRAEVIRFRNPNKVVTFTDLVRGEISVDTTDLGDFVIAKSIDDPVFHLAVVVDDYEMGVNHVIRGEDHIPNTPRHILIMEAVGAPIPKFAHLPIVLAQDRTKLSKRKGALPLTDYRDRGYLPEAMINYMAMIGWNPGGEQDIFTKDEIIDLFDITKVQKGGGIFDDVKLKWVNREHMLKLSPEEYKKNLETFMPEHLSTLDTYKPRIDSVCTIVRDRLEYFKQIQEMYDEGDIEYFFVAPLYDADILLCSEKMRKGKDLTHAGLAKILATCKLELEKLPEEKGEFVEGGEVKWNKESVKNVLWPIAESEGRGIVLWAVRVALSGKEKSPDPFILAETIGRDETLARIQRAETFLKEKTIVS
jgi:glutamyl-tRNA synthetase/nondiscriminating glutamyl-tRNA synthetase